MNRDASPRLRSSVARLVEKIVTLKSNPHYRLADIIHSRGLRHQQSAASVLGSKEFEGTILRDYLEIHGPGGHPDIPLLAFLVEDRLARGWMTSCHQDEIAIHIRAGDVVEHDWFLQRDFSGELARHRFAGRCTLVSCFAFQEFTERRMWLFTEEKLQANIERLSALLSSLLQQFPHIRFEVVSHEDIDRDFVYLASAPHFIRDVGGFSDLVEAVRSYRRLHVAPPHAYSQALRRIGFRPRPFPPNAAIAGGDDRLTPYLGGGWHASEGTHRWSEGRAADLLFEVPSTDRPHALRLEAHSLRGDDAVTVTVNGRPTSPAPSARGGVVVPLPDALAHVVLSVGGSASPRSLGIGDDGRDLGVRLVACELVALLPGEFLDQI